MKTQLQKTLVLSCLLASAFCIFASAQIIYTDANQLIVCHGISSGKKFTCSDSFKLDLNSDSINDYRIQFTYFSSKKILFSYETKINSLNKNTVASDGQYPLAMNAGDTISSDLNWNAFSTLFQTSSGGCDYWGCGGGDTSGNWKPGLVSYLGLKLILGGKTYYGWVRINIGESSLTVYDYAYSSIPDQSILAEETGGIATEASSIKNKRDFSVFPNPASNKITLSFSSAEKREIQIINTLGQLVFSEQINSAKGEINVAEFSSGIYTVSVQTSVQKIENKFLKQ